MFCWEARAALDRQEVGWLAGAEARRLQAHIEACAGCRTEHDRRGRLASLVSDAGRVESPVAPQGFEAAVMRAARARAAERPRGRKVHAAWLAPLPVAAAASVVVAGLLLALLRGPAAERPLVQLRPGEAQTSGPVETGDDSLAASLADDVDDQIAPPREIPFTVREDLVGDRRGRIPMTTYVLEPPPVEGAVVRASL
jgi:anti-sigma factor RsiW